MDAEESRVPAWRTGRKVGRTIYFQRGEEPADDDPLVGVMDTPELAGAAVRGLNWLTAEGLIDRRQIALLTLINDGGEET